MPAIEISPTFILKVRWDGRTADHVFTQELETQRIKWEPALQLAGEHIQQFFKLTGSLPVAGDRLSIAKADDDTFESRSLFIAHRELNGEWDNQTIIVYSIGSIDVEEEWAYEQFVASRGL